MTNGEKYKQGFITSFGVSEKDLPKLKYQGVDSWDSIGHMNLIAELENAFDIVMETDDIVGFTSYKKGVEVLKKYGIGL
jgi:acyl carrier protein